MDILNSDGFIGKIKFRSNKLHPISNPNQFYIYKNIFLSEKGKIVGYFVMQNLNKNFQSSAIL